MKLNHLLLIPLYLILCACGDTVESVTEFSEDEIQQLRLASEAYANQNIAILSSDKEAILLGKQLFTAHCTNCHGAGDGTDHEDKKGVTNLINGIYDYGSSEEDIFTSINQGRHSKMPALGNTLGEVDLGILVAYIKSFSSDPIDSIYLSKALALYKKNCVSCHGENGLGNSDLGIPNLSDEYWQHGASTMRIRLNITRGIESQCPAQAGKMTKTEIELLSAFILQRREPIAQ